MIDRELERLRGFYNGLTDTLEVCHKRLVETNGVIEGLVGLCQEHLTMLSDLEYENAKLRKENRNIKIHIEQKGGN